MQRSVFEATFDEIVVHVGLLALGLETDDGGEPVFLQQSDEILVNGPLNAVPDDANAFAAQQKSHVLAQE